ncbi:MAG: class I SAM-dependent methyltransferase [Roseinatronobacter sp.]|jgi:SAM-dependent methyltransferase|nr:class I SAM-dependent methyltransferase [Roseinatronobacter sp.]
MGFSAQWLALRDPADRAARDATVLRAAAKAAGPEPLILDLGCGTGATWRALSPFLPEGTRWRLVDNDPDLLRLAAAQIGPDAETVLADLADSAALPLDGVTLVTASALLDLVSEAWLHALVARLDMPFYAALSYDGQMQWVPEHPQDGAITRAFNQHQRRDKGFGAALGPDAGPRALAAFGAAGFSVQQAQSPWQIGPDMAQLHQELVAGIAQAAQDIGLRDAPDWAHMRQSQMAQAFCTIGHVDILAIPAAHRSEGQTNAG